MSIQYNEKQLDYIEAAAMAIVVGLSSHGACDDANRLADIAHTRAEAMLAEREKRYGKIEKFM